MDLLNMEIACCKCIPEFYFHKTCSHDHVWMDKFYFNQFNRIGNNNKCYSQQKPSRIQLSNDIFLNDDIPFISGKYPVVGKLVNWRRMWLRIWNIDGEDIQIID